MGSKNGPNRLFSRLPRSNANQKIGTFGEDAAARYLKKKKYRILERNFRTDFGEIDLIAKEGAYFVFIEVKTRSSDRFGAPWEAVDRRKQKTILNVAQQYLKETYEESFVRFDIIEVYIANSCDKMEVTAVNQIENAFGG